MPFNRRRKVSLLAWGRLCQTEKKMNAQADRWHRELREGIGEKPIVDRAGCNERPEVGVEELRRLMTHASQTPTVLMLWTRMCSSGV